MLGPSSVKAVHTKLRNPKFRDSTIRTTGQHYNYHGGAGFRAEVWFTRYVWHVVLQGPKKLLDEVGYKRPLKFEDGQAMLDLFEQMQELVETFPELLDDYDVIHEERRLAGKKQCNQAQGRGHAKY
jgi:hypothetical protein